MKFTIIRTDKENGLHLQTKTAEWFFERIRTDTKAEDIGRLRLHIANNGDLGLYERRHPIALVYPSVEMAKTDNGNLNILTFNGLATLHVGGLLREEDIEAVKEASKILPTTFAAFTGADGRSVEILVAVTPKSGVMPETESDIDTFCQKAYDVAFCAYGGILPKPIERQTVSAKKGFRMTLDATPYYNPEPTPLTVQTKSSLLPASDNGLDNSDEQREVDMTLYADYERMYARAAALAYEETSDVIESQRADAYITELAVKLCEMGVPEEEAFLHIRNHHAYSETYDMDECRAIVEAVYTENKPSRSQNQSEVSQETRQMIRFLTTRYVFRYNTVMGYTEYRPNNTWIQDWRPCDEAAVNGLTIEARLSNLDVRDKDVRRYVHSSLIRQSNPVEDYLLKAAKAWDGKTDHIAMLARTVPCDIPQWELWFKKWFVYMVAQWLPNRQEYGNSIVPLLISPQGDGKTSFCRNLLPKELSWGFIENQDVSDKRPTLQAMHNYLLINIDEFNSVAPKVQEGFLKNIIQLPSVKIKRPYGKHVEEFKRYASFIATTNEQNVLSDPTGSRRFICVSLTAPIDTDYQPNYEALYGQAYTIVTERRMQWWFTPEETAQIQAHNKQFQMVPPAIQYFNEYYEAAADESEGTWLSPTAIYDRLRRIAGAGLKANGVAAFGRHLWNMPDLKHRRTGSSKQYLVRETNRAK